MYTHAPTKRHHHTILTLNRKRWRKSEEQKEGNRQQALGQMQLAFQQIHFRNCVTKERNPWLTQTLDNKHNWYKFKQHSSQNFLTKHQTMILSKKRLTNKNKRCAKKKQMYTQNPPWTKMAWKKHHNRKRGCDDCWSVCNAGAAQMIRVGWGPRGHPKTGQPVQHLHHLNIWTLLALNQSSLLKMMWQR